MAEIENSAMARQCLSRRISEKQVVEEETSAWSEKRKEAGAAVFAAECEGPSNAGGRVRSAS
jgi:hypothetical protein